VGVTNAIIVPFYKGIIRDFDSPVALLGFVDNSIFEGDIYDIQKGNWDINSKWELDKKYNTIICTRCAYFAKDPEDFIIRCYDSLNVDGKLYVDWGVGDHWRFKNFKVGWVKGGEQEFAYGKENYLWSMVWDESFLLNNQYKMFEKEIEKIGYDNLKNAIFEEVPTVLDYGFIKKYFDITYTILTIVKPHLQMYVFIKGMKK